MLDDLEIEQSVGNTPLKEDHPETPKKFSLYDSKVQDSILLLESQKKSRPDEEKLQMLKNEVNASMSELKKDSMELMIDVFRK